MVVLELLTAVGPLVAEHGRRLQLTGSRAWAQQLWRVGLVALPHVGPPRPGLEPVSLAWQGRFLAPGPPGKPSLFVFYFFGIYLYLYSPSRFPIGNI